MSVAGGRVCVSAAAAFTVCEGASVLCLHCGQCDLFTGLFTGLIHWTDASVESGAGGESRTVVACRTASPAGKCLALPQAACTWQRF